MKTDLRKQARISADSSLVVVVDPSGFFNEPIEYLTLCFYFIYLCSRLGLDLSSDIIDDS